MFNRLLDHITMYRLTIYYLSALLAIAVLFSAIGWLSFNPLDIMIVTAEVVGGVLLANQIMADLLGASINTESSIITALILALIIAPKFPISFIPIALAGSFAIGSKYLATIMDHHVFNPVAAGAVALALLSDTSATWWVGTPILLPFVIAGGYLVVKKVNRERMVAEFLLSFLTIVGSLSLIHTGSLISMFNTWYMSLTHTALLFFAAVMFTEPATSPGTNTKRSYFAYLTAVLYATPQLNLAGIVFTPEMALVMANAFSFAINPQYRYVLRLKMKRLIARDTYEFEFETQTPLKYVPGQYMEWTLPHPKMDNRGNRRYFSLSSTASELPAFAIKYYTPPSSYKANLLTLPIGGTLSATSLAGDFTLPNKLNEPLVFVAGGIGIAPFRSMIKQVTDEKRKVDITLIYVNKTADEVCYLPLWEEAKAYGVTTHFCLTDGANLPKPWHGLTGHLTPEMIKSVLPKWQSSTYYISGPQRLVESVEQVLNNIKIPKNQIITDFFPGY